MSSFNSIKKENISNTELGTQINNKSLLSSEENSSHQHNSSYSETIGVKHICCENSEYEIGNGYIKCLRSNMVIKQEPPINSLSYYVVHNHIDKLRDSLMSGLQNPNCRDDFGVTCSWTPLYWSIKIGNKEAARTLLEFGADINLVIHDFHECCGTVLDLATLREDLDMEELLRSAADNSGVNLGQSFKALRTKLRGKAPAFNFRHYGKNAS